MRDGVSRWLPQISRGTARASARKLAGRNPLQAPPVTPAPKTREVTRWLLTHPGNLDPADQARLDAATAQCPHVDDLATL